jgi:hypothetical protein
MAVEGDGVFGAATRCVHAASDEHANNSIVRRAWRGSANRVRIMRKA